MRVYRLSALPLTPETDALYFIGADGVGLCRAYVSGHTGNLNEVEGVTNDADIQALIDANEVTAGAGLVKVGNEIRLAIGALPIAG